MRAAWGNQGGTPPYTKLAANGIGWPYFDARDTRLSAAFLGEVDGHEGIEGVGLYVAASWFEGVSPEDVAEWTDKRLRAIAWLGNPPVMFDVETAEPVGYSLRLLGRWRELRPKRVTDLTIEGHKGALFRPADVVNVVAKTRYTVPQCYDGAMTPWDTWAIMDDLQQAGFPRAHIAPFCAAAHLMPWWGVPAGFAFTWELLP